MAADKEKREKFVKSVMKFIDRWNFDGLQLAWQYPVCKQVTFQIHADTFYTMITKDSCAVAMPLLLLMQHTTNRNISLDTSLRLCPIGDGVTTLFNKKISSAFQDSMWWQQRGRQNQLQRPHLRTVQSFTIKQLGTVSTGRLFASNSVSRLRPRSFGRQRGLDRRRRERLLWLVEREDVILGFFRNRWN